MSAGSLDLGNLYARLGVDYSDLNRAENAALSFANNTQKQLDKVSSSLKSVGAKMTTAVTLPLIGAGTAAVKFSSDFDKAVREVNSLIDPKDQNFEGLKNDIRGVSLSLGIDLVESAKAAYSALGAGVPKDNLIDFLTIASKSAIGGVTSVETAVDGFTSVMNAWGKSAGNVTEVSDVMFQAVKYGKVTFEQFASSISTVSGMASEFGVSFKEVAAYSALATAQGEKQTVAMTQMRAAITELVKPNKEMGALIEASGIKSIKATLAQKGLAGTYAILRQEAEKGGGSVSKSVGSIEALQYILKSTGKNAEEASKFLALMGTSAGASDAAFKELDKARGFDKLVNDLKALGTIIGDIITPVIMPIVEQFTKWTVEASKLDPGLIRIGVAFAAVAAAVGPLLLGAGALLGVIAPILTGSGALSAILATLATVALPVTIAFAAVAAAGYLLYKNWEDVKKWCSDLVNYVIGYFQKWTSDNKELIDSIFSSWSSFVESGKSLWDALSEIIVTFATDCINYLDSLLAPIGGLQGAWELFEVGVGIALTSIGEYLNAFFEGGKIVFDEITNWLKSGGTSWQEFKDIGTKALEGLGYAFIVLGVKVDEFVIKIADGLKQVPQAFKIIFDEVTNYLKNIPWKQIGSDLMQGLKNGITGSYEGVTDAMESVGVGMENAVRDVLDTHSPSLVFMQIGKDVMDGLSLGIKNNSSGAESTIREAMSRFVSEANRTAILNPTFSKGVGGDIEKSNLDITIEEAQYAKSLELLKQAEEQKIASIQPYYQLREQMEKQHQDKLASFEEAKLDAQLTATSEFFGNLSVLTRSKNKELFAIGKAAAIAQATVDGYQAIGKAMASAAPPYNYILAAGVGVAVASNIANIASTKAYGNGGYIPTGQVGMVGERGPEFVSGPANVFSAQNTKELMNSKGGGGGNVSVKVLNFGNSKVEVSESGSDREKFIEIVIDRAKQSIVGDAIRGDGAVDKAFASVFKLARTG